MANVEETFWIWAEKLFPLHKSSSQNSSERHLLQQGSTKHQILKICILYQYITVLLGKLRMERNYNSYKSALLPGSNRNGVTHPSGMIIESELWLQNSSINGVEDRNAELLLQGVTHPCSKRKWNWFYPRN